jgi:hypothetical protein
MNEQEILRETFDSMASWFRRNTAQLSPDYRDQVMYAVSPEESGLNSVGGATIAEEEDPLVLFERLKAQRSAAAPPLPPPTAAPLRIPELEAIETRPRPPQTIQQKDVLQRQEDVIKYRESEYNLVLNSKDRDWVHGTAENRYNFTIQLNGGTREQGTGVQATILNRFKNITRIEFVKAILPVEGLDVAYPRVITIDDETYDTELCFNSALALPSVTVIMDEMQGNNFGTNDAIDKSLAVCQYDATWRTDSLNGEHTINRGYTLFFPKFMKAQRVYAPTPLANLQKMSFRLQNPENQLLSTVADAYAIQKICYASDLPAGDTTTSNYDIDVGGLSPATNAATAEYLFIQTDKWFPLWAYSLYDKIQLGGLTPPVSITDRAAARSFINWLQRDEGHIVVGIAYTNAGNVIKDKSNTFGYSNWIIIRNKCTDPSENQGTPTRMLFTGSSGAETTFAQEWAAQPVGSQKGAVLNLNRQVQLTLRIITREFDSASNVRPDNV